LFLEEEESTRRDKQRFETQYTITMNTYQSFIKKVYKDLLSDRKLCRRLGTDKVIAKAEKIIKTVKH
jgi:hypothetical protein